MKIVVFGNTYQRENLKEVKHLLNFLIDSQVEVHVKEEFLTFLEGKVGEIPKVVRMKGEIPAPCTIAISFGGDGTFLQTANQVGSLEIPILGINTGHLGFLSGVSTQNAKEILTNVLKGLYKVEKRCVLSLHTMGALSPSSAYSLNEVAIAKRDSSSMIKIGVKIDGRYLTTYRGDGLIISTPTGSTAYSLSVNGPILSPDLPCILLTPISPHSLSIRPLVVSDKSVIELSISGRDDHYLVALDGRSHTFDMSTTLKVSKALHQVSIVQPLEHDFYTTLRQKLNWGELPLNC